MNRRDYERLSYQLFKANATLGDQCKSIDSSGKAYKLKSDVNDILLLLINVNRELLSYEGLLEKDDKANTSSTNINDTTTTGTTREMLLHIEKEEKSRWKKCLN